MAELQDLIDSLARRIGRPVAIDDPRFRLVAYSAHTGHVDKVRTEWVLTRHVPDAVARWVNAQNIQNATEPVRVRGNRDLELDDRVAIPVRYRDRLLGFLWLIDHDHTLSDPAIARAEEAAVLAADIMYRDHLVDDLRRGQERELLRDLLSERAEVREQAAIALREADLLSASGRYAFIAAGRIDGGRLASTGGWMEMALWEFRQRQPRRSFMHLVRPDHGILVWSLPPGSAAEPSRRNPAVTRGLLEDLRAAHSGEVAVGISGMRTDIDESPDAHREALLALNVAAVIDRFRPVAAWPELGIYQMLARYPAGDIEPAMLPGGLLRLIEAKDRVHLLRTLEVYLDNAGGTASTAADLDIHRVSLYARLNRIEQITGMDLGNGQDRLALHLGIKLARLGGLLSQNEPD